MTPVAVASPFHEAPHMHIYIFKVAWVGGRIAIGKEASEVAIVE